MDNLEIKPYHNTVILRSDFKLILIAFRINLR